jgi:hypothetical protein
MDFNLDLGAVLQADDFELHVRKLYGDNVKEIMQHRKRYELSDVMEDPAKYCSRYEYKLHPRFHN